jgi:PAS domain S-box-containing protein
MAESVQQILEQFEPGIIWLDEHNVITAMNAIAVQTFGDSEVQMIGKEVFEIHPEKSREKIRTLFEQASDPADTAPPMTVLLNSQQRVLLIKLSNMAGSSGDVGSCMVFFDITELTRGSGDKRTDDADAGGDLRLLKLPVYKNKQVLLVELNDGVADDRDGSRGGASVREILEQADFPRMVGRSPDRRITGELQPELRPHAEQQIGRDHRQ